MNREFYRVVPSGEKFHVQKRTGWFRGWQTYYRYSELGWLDPPLEFNTRVEAEGFIEAQESKLAENATARDWSTRYCD